MLKPKFTFTLDNGTISVLDPIDDLTFTHKAFFAKGTDGKLRRAWVFRWLQAPERFYADTGGTVLSAQHEKQLQGKPRADVARWSQRRSGRPKVRPWPSRVNLWQSINRE